MSDVMEHPRYKLLAPFNAENDTLYPEGTVITYLGEPNEHMQPLNGAAEDRMADFLRKLDKFAELKAAIDGKAFVKRAGDLGDFAEEAMRSRPREPRAVPGSDGVAPVRPDLETKAMREARRARRAQALLGADLPLPPKRGEAQAAPIPILGSISRPDQTRGL